MSNTITAWSYSRYADYKQCPLKFKLKHIDRIRGTGPSAPALVRGSEIHLEGELWLKGGGKGRVPSTYTHFKDEMKQLAKLSPIVEQQWGFTKDWKPATGSGRDPNGWFAKDTFLRIVCDVAVVYDDHTADVIDFKTGRKYDTNEEQVELFSTGIKMRYPETTTVTTRLWYLDQPNDNEVIREYSAKDIENIKKDWDRKIQPMFNDRKFPPKPNDKCKWCDYRKDAGGPCIY